VSDICAEFQYNDHQQAYELMARVEVFAARPYEHNCYNYLVSAAMGTSWLWDANHSPETQCDLFYLSSQLDEYFQTLVEANPGVDKPG
jgi:hypothetical protein